MYQASEQFNNIINQNGGRTFHYKLECPTFSITSGIKKITYHGGSSGEDALTIGSAVGTYIEVSMEKTSYDFDGKEISLFLGLKTIVGMEYIPMGIFKVKKPSVTDYEMSFKAYDRMDVAEKNYASSLSYPTNTVSVMNEISEKLGISFITEIEAIQLNNPDNSIVR